MNRTRPRTLIVEDEQILAQAIGRLLDYWGLDSLIAGTVARAKSSLDIPFDLILLDLMLPDGNGLDILRAIREHKIPGRVVIWTALPLPELAVLAALKPDRVLSKPSSFDELRDLAAEIRDGFAARGGAPAT